MHEPESKLQWVEKENAKLLNDESDDKSWVVVEEQKSNCMECANKDAELKNLRYSEAVLKRDRSQIVKIQQQYVGMAMEITAIKIERDDALKKVKNLEISLASADSQIKSLLSKSENFNDLMEENTDLRSILSKVFVAFDRLERFLKQESEYRQTVNSESAKKFPCSSCSYKDKFFLSFRNDFVKANAKQS